MDLYQIHRWDPNVPIEETMDALNEVVRSGKARYIGASSMHAWQFAKAQHVAERNGWAKFVSMQNHYNLLYREEEREMIPQCIDQGIGVIPWSPLARGVLAGNRTRDGEKRTTRSNTDQFTDYLYSEGDFDVVDRVVEVAAERAVPPAQVALAWLLHRPGVTAPIIGATKLGHLEDALAAEELSLERRRDAAARGALRAAPRPRSLSGARRVRAARALRRVRELERPVEEVLGLVQDLLAVLHVRDVARALPGGEVGDDPGGLTLGQGRLGPRVRNERVGGAVEVEHRRVAGIDRHEERRTRERDRGAARRTSSRGCRWCPGRRRRRRR